MPEDDFDIYGEDDGFNAALADEVRRAQQPRQARDADHGEFLLQIDRKFAPEDYMSHEDEGGADLKPVDDVTPAVHSPSVGEKRPRDEDDEPEPRREISPPRGSNSLPPNPMNGVSQTLQTVGHQSLPQPPITNLQSEFGGGASGAPFDALYIGELQWVSHSIII
jgi:hypothetical protein